MKRCRNDWPVRFRRSENRLHRFLYKNILQLLRVLFQINRCAINRANKTEYQRKQPTIPIHDSNRLHCRRYLMLRQSDCLLGSIQHPKSGGIRTVPVKLPYRYHEGPWFNRESSAQKIIRRPHAPTYPEINAGRTTLCARSSRLLPISDSREVVFIRAASSTPQHQYYANHQRSTNWPIPLTACTAPVPRRRSGQRHGSFRPE